MIYLNTANHYYAISYGENKKTLKLNNYRIKIRTTVLHTILFKITNLLRIAPLF
jgi:hypothetical protein